MPPFEVTYQPGHKAILDDILLPVPGVKGGKMFGYPGYKVNNKVFAFVGGPGIALKLPAARVQQLIVENEAMLAFEPVEGTVWREWVSIHHDDSDAFQRYDDLYHESIEFVAG